MTPKAEALLDGLLDACIDSDNISADYQALVAYIEELERKTQAYNATCPHCGNATCMQCGGIAGACNCNRDQ